MRFTNRFANHSTENYEANQNAIESFNKWGNMASNNNFEAQARLGNEAINQTKDQLAQQERQERKLIGALLYGPENFAQPDLRISEQDRHAVYQELTNGHIDDNYKSHVLQEVATPFHQSPTDTISSLNTKQERRILAYLGGTGFDQWKSVSTQDLQNTLNNFPTPYELASVEQTFLEAIRANNPPQKYAEYLDAMESFKHKTYGKRYEYFNTLESLQQKANQESAAESARTRVLDTYANTAPLSPETTYENVEVRRLNSREQEKILKKSKIDGDQFFYNGIAYQLTPETLKNFGLAPNYSFQLENAKINLSNPYRISGRPAVTAYVQTDKGINVCSYYRSNSQGIWRLLPEYVPETQDPNRTISWFGKGYNEESLNLPSETQYALELITAQAPEVPLNSLHAEFAFAGTAKRYNSREEHAQYKKQHALRGQHYAEVAQAPILNLGQINYSKATPESLDLDGPSSPDFSRSQNPYTTNANLYGQIYVEHLPSKDNSLIYTFSRNAAKQAWLSGIEIRNAPISSTGLRTDWASAGDYGTPLYEYTSQSVGYGDPNDTKDDYTSMWKNYLSRMPLIKKYLATRPS